MTDVARRTGPVINDQLLTEYFGHRYGELPCPQIIVAACWIRDDHRDRLRWILRRLGEAGPEKSKCCDSDDAATKHMNLLGF